MRKHEIALSRSESVAKISEAFLKDFDWSLRVVMGSSDLSTTRKAILLLTLSLENPNGDVVNKTYEMDLDSLNDLAAEFTLTSWLQYFRFVVPKRKYYKNTCQWEYKGAECQYPGPGELPIPGTDLKSNANPIKADNTVGSNPNDDVCGKSLLACQVRNNDIHYGAFPATGRTIPRQ